MLVGRFSHTGFDPQFQTYMKEYVDSLLSWNEENCKKDFPHSWKVMKEGVMHHRKRLNPHFNFTGIHVFFLPLMDDVVRFQLNHLRGERPPFHQQWFADCTPCYPLDCCFSRPISTLEKLLADGHEGAYVPL